MYLMLMHNAPFYVDVDIHVTSLLTRMLLYSLECVGNNPSKNAFAVSVIIAKQDQV